MKKLFIALILLNGCSFNDYGYFSENNNDVKKEIINFENDYTIDEYKNLLEKYSKESDYPNMDK
mgnify:CR=1 FL=1